MAQTVLITGASRGIGASTARQFARQGWQVAVNYCHSEQAALALCDELNAFPVRGDVSDPAQVTRIFAETIRRFGGLDALVCNAGIALPSSVVQDVSDADWARLLGINVSGVFYCCRCAIPLLLQSAHGKIITLSSMWGQVGGSCEAAYSASKGAVIAFSKALAQELAPSGINVNCVAPGVVDTDMMAFAAPELRSALAEETPLGRLGTPEDIAAAVYFLATEGADFITGQVLGVNGGFVI